MASLSFVTPSVVGGVILPVYPYSLGALNRVKDSGVGRARERISLLGADEQRLYSTRFLFLLPSESPESDMSLPLTGISDAT